MADKTGVICVKGQLTRDGVDCQTLRAEEDGEVYSLVGDLGGFKPGDLVVACGLLVDVSPCSKGTTIALTSLSKPFKPKDPDQKHVRNVQVEVTAWSGDRGPTFKLEGEDYGLDLDSKAKKWNGRFWDVVIEGELEVDFISKAPPEKQFELKVTASVEGDTKKNKTKTWVRRAGKKAVRFDEAMEV